MMHRREFLRLAAATPLLAVAPAGLAVPGRVDAGWRTFELAYEVDLATRPDSGRLWLPLPDNAGNYQRVLSIRCATGPATASLTWDSVYQAPVYAAELNRSESARHITVVAQVATRDREMAPAGRVLHNVDEAALYLRPTEHMPVDGIVAETSASIVKGLESADDKARAIYDWVVDHTFRDPATKGCGMGNIKAMLETGNLGGKCADINSLFVGLARAAGVPAREMYGVRVAESAQLACLGKSGDVSRAQHCRAEYFSSRYGWVPVDPADVRKAALEAKLALDDPRLIALRNRLFGYWEMNWVGFNHARDFELSPRASRPLPYLMYPYAEFGGMRLDGRDPGDFKFSLLSREIAA